MNDTISRQQTITALRALSDEDGYINAPHEVVTDVVRGLPPAQTELEDKIFAIGYAGKEGRIYIGGRLFAVRELAQ